MLYLQTRRKQKSQLHSDRFEEKVRYIYILEVDNRGRRSRHGGNTKILYTGMTSSIIKRINEHLTGVNSAFLKRFYNGSIKKLIFIKQVFGTEYDASLVESKLKSMSKDGRLKLINSDYNELIRYHPFKAIVLKDYLNKDDQICLKL